MSTLCVRTTRGGARAALVSAGALAALLAAAPARAQQPPTQPQPQQPQPPQAQPPQAQPGPAGDNPLPAGHPAVDAQPAPGQPELPAGHPGVDTPGGGDPHAGMTNGDAPNFRQVQVPQTAAAEAADLPPGTVQVRVLDAEGHPLPDAPVRLGSMRDGERGAARDARTGADGIARFEGLERGSSTAYRASVEHQGARFSANPFVLPGNAGYRVQIVRFDVEHEPRSVLINDARVEVSFADDRLVVVQRVSLVNFSNVSIDGRPPHPVAFVPPGDGLRFRLPQGYSAFRTDDESMGDQKLVEQNGYAVLRGSVPPTGAEEPIQLTFQYRVKVSGTDVDLTPALPLPVLRATVVAQQPVRYTLRFAFDAWPPVSRVPEPMRLEVDGMPDAQERNLNGQRIVLTGRERRTREDPPLDEFRIHLRGIPGSAGPERVLALLVALSIALVSMGFALRNARGRRRGADVAALKEMRARLLADAAELARAHKDGEVGPETYGRRRREIAHALAEVLKGLAESGGGGAHPAGYRGQAAGA